MKKLQILTILIFLSGILCAQTLEDFLKEQPEIKSIEQITGNSFFENTYKIMVEQPIDHSDLSKGTFEQRVFVADKNKHNPVVLITEGYGGAYAGRKNYINELSPMLNANQICIEHRYFGESWPKERDWQYLTVRNAAADHHHIVELMKPYYTGKWINTGISKGGQTVVYHRWLYPNDVDASVAYVCPLNFDVEDGRHEPFIANIPGSNKQRAAIEAFQIEILKNREKLLPKLRENRKKKNYTFRISMDEVLDFCILEYPFALWQWGHMIDEIPATDENIDDLFKHLITVSGPAYFSIEGMEGIKSFFIQAAHELGYYGYDTKPLKKYLVVKNAKNYLNKIFISEEVKIKYDRRTAREVKKFIQSTSAEILFIYGAWDPWSASAFEVPQKPNFLKIMKPKGSHSTRIKNLPAEQKKQVKKQLETWLDMPFNIKN